MTAIPTAKATLHTNHGDIVVNLFGHQAPKTVKNFVGLADGSQEWTDPKTGEKKNTPLYEGVIFHRIIRDFMVQGGDPLGQGIGGPGSQFFITTVPTTWLQGKHTIFGEVADDDSKKVVDEIEGVATGMMDRPVEDVVIKNIDIEQL